MWLSAVVVVVHYFALFCYTVCCALSCAGTSYCVPLPALVCYVALCATLRDYPGRDATAVGAEFGQPSKRLDRTAHPLSGAGPSPRGLPLRLARMPCLWAAVGVCG